MEECLQEDRKGRIKEGEEGCQQKGVMEQDDY